MTTATRTRTRTRTRTNGRPLSSATTAGHRPRRRRTIDVDCSDFELLAGWRAGERSAGEQLFDRHFASVYGFFRRKLDDVAEDLTQQTFLRCFEAFDHFRTEASFRTYLFAIARNVLLGDLRRRSRRPDPDPEVDALADREPSSSTLLELCEEHSLLVQALQQLPDDLQVALGLYYVQDLRGRELVAALGVPSGTVRSRIRRGLERLRITMAELASSPHPLPSSLTALDDWAVAPPDSPR